MRKVATLGTLLAQQATTNGTLAVACERSEARRTAKASRVLRQEAARPKAPKKVFRAKNHRRVYTNARHV